jgi:hypothetical protein
LKDSTRIAAGKTLKQDSIAAVFDDQRRKLNVIGATKKPELRMAAHEAPPGTPKSGGHAHAVGFEQVRAP